MDYFQIERPDMDSRDAEQVVKCEMKITPGGISAYPKIFFYKTYRVRTFCMQTRPDPT